MFIPPEEIGLSVRQSWQLWNSVLPEEVISNIIEDAESNYEIVQASTFAGDTSEHRTSNVRWLSDNWTVREIMFNFAILAAKTFNIQIYRDGDIQFTEYLASEGGHYDWHHDVDWNRSDGIDRKISVILQLSDQNDYEGGDFKFSEVESPKSESMKMKGTVLCFPSYLQHQVTPVTSGTRKSVVAWFEGPQWR